MIVITNEKTNSSLLQPHLTLNARLHAQRMVDEVTCLPIDKPERVFGSEGGQRKLGRRCYFFVRAPPNGNTWEHAGQVFSSQQRFDCWPAGKRRGQAGGAVSLSELLLEAAPAWLLSIKHWPSCSSGTTQLDESGPPEFSGFGAPDT